MSCSEKLNLCCAVCRVGCFMIYQRLCCKKPPPERPRFNPVCIGLGGVGKSTILAILTGEDTDDIPPTTGFVYKAVQFPDCILNVKEIGGREKVRPYWKHYYKGVDAVVFVIDSSSYDDDLEEAKDALQEALGHSALKELPCLILANCQDKDGAKDVTELSYFLEVEKLCTGRPFVIQSCSSKNPQSVREAFEKLTPFLVQAGTDADDVAITVKADNTKI